MPGGLYCADDNTISFLDGCDRGASLHDDTHTLVTHRPWHLPAAEYPMVYVEITATDGGGGYTDDGVSFINNLGFGNPLRGNLKRLALPEHGLHSVGVMVPRALVPGHDLDLV